MKNAFIIHGAFGSPEENWIPWLRANLTRQGYQVTAPAFPTPEGQTYEQWTGVMVQYVDMFTEETVLIGHSIGATFALCVLEQIDVSIAKTILVSGFLGHIGRTEFDEINHSIAGREFDWDTIRNNSKECIIIHGADDPYVSTDKARELGQLLNTEPIFIAQGGHLNTEAGYSTFNELLQLV